MKQVRTLFLILASGFSPVLWADLPMVSDLQVMAQPPGASVTAGYLTINNHSNDPLVITGASSDVISRVEMHESVVHNDVASMTKHETIEIDAGQTLEFKHGGFHLMLMELTEQLMPGSTIDITLHTNQGDVELSMPVIMPSMDHKMDNKMDHSDMSKDMQQKHGETPDTLKPKVVH